MLKSIRTKSLYGRHDYFLDLSKHAMTIITGPNGYGKTTIIRIIHDVLDDDLFDLVGLPFEEIELIADGDAKLLFQKSNGEVFLNGVKLVVPSDFQELSGGQILFTISKQDYRGPSNRLRAPVFAPQQVLHVQYVQSSRSTSFSQDLLIRTNFQLLGEGIQKIADDLLRFYESVGNSVFCGADRLYRDYTRNNARNDRKTFINVIDSLSGKLERIINSYNNRYTQLSNEFDYRFMSQLAQELSVAKNESYQEADYESDVALINEKLERMFDYGFLTKDKMVLGGRIRFNKTYSLAYKVFADNYKQKLYVLEELTKKVDLFLKIVNSKLVNKKIQIKQAAKRDELIVALDGDRKIKLSSLSSGEQEIIVLYFKLIFEAEQKMIALIDEPELSSHVSWQFELLDDFEKVLSVNKNVKQIIVCTHSPQVINDRWEQTIDMSDAQVMVDA